MKNFQQFDMDTNTWIATVGAGTLLEDVTDRMHDAGGRVIAKVRNRIDSLSSHG